MSSLFDLPQSIGELSSNSSAKYRYEEVAPLRDVAGTNFSNGAISFKWQTSSGNWWQPSKSFLRLRAKFSALRDGEEYPVSVADDLAVNMDAVSNLFQSMEFRIHNKTVSRVGDYVSQVSALHKRLSKSRAHLESVGQSTNAMSHDFGLRQSLICKDAVVSAETPTLTYLTKAELGIPAAVTLETKAAQSQAIVGVGAPNVFRPGDKIRIGAASYDVITVTPSAGTYVLGIDPAPGDSAASNATVFARLRSEASVNALGKQNIEFCYVPPLSIFGISHCMPAGDWELTLNPQVSGQWERRLVESALGSKTPGVEYKITIDSLSLQVAVMNGPRMDSGSYVLDLESLRCQTDSISSTALSSKYFDVSPSTVALAIAYQDIRAGSNTLNSPSKFKVGNANNTVREQELALNRFYVSYAGLQRPSPDSSAAFNVDTDRTAERYLDTMIESGAFFSEGGCETLREFQSRGTYYFFSYPKDGSDRSTRVQISNQFQSDADVSNMRVLLFDLYKSVCRVQMKDGAIVNVELEDV